MARVDPRTGADSSGKTQVLVLAALLVLLFSLRVPGLRNSPLETGESWRQPDTESIAVNFVNYGLHPLRPNLDYDGPLPNVPALELQVTTTLIAILYKLLGRHFILARLVPLAFFLTGCVFLYLFSRRHIGHWGAVWATAFYGLIPNSLFNSRTIQPEAFAVCMSLAALYLFQRYIDAKSRSGVWLALCGVALFFALTQKPQTALIALPMIGPAWRKYGWRLFARRELWVFAVTALGLAAGYYIYSNSVAEFRFVYGIATKHIFTGFYRDVFSKRSQDWFAAELPRAFTGLGLAMVAAALVAVRRDLGIIYLWLLGAGIYLAAVVAVIRLPYYLVYATPAFAVLVGAPLGRLKGWGMVAPLGLLAVLASMSISTVRPLLHQEWAISDAAAAIDRVSAHEDLIVLASFNPAALDAADRRGWRFNIKYYPFVPAQPIDELNYYITRGAKYFATVGSSIEGDEDGSIRRYLDAHYARLEPIKGNVIYDLTKYK